VVEIEDRGIGMSPTAIEETNRRLAQPPDFDPADSNRLGLLVVATLAAQHGITVTLSRTEDNGIRAVMTLPPALTVAIEQAPPTPAPARRSDASRLVGMAMRAGRRPRHAAAEADAGRASMT